MNKQDLFSPGRLLTGIVLLALLLPPLLREGMFIDGIFYGTIARNLAEGMGSFWQPSFSSTFAATSYAHPPLAFGLESLLFRVLGDHFWVERLFSLLMAIASAGALAYLWRLLHPQFRQWDWLPVLAWIIVPRVFWSYTHNMLENLVTLWTLLAVAMMVGSLQRNTPVRGGITVSLFLLFGFLTKGFVAFFPLAVPLGYGLIMKVPVRKWLQLYGWIGIGLFAAFLFLWFYPPSNEFFTAYFQKQLVRSFNGEMVIQHSISKGALLVRLLEELIPSFSLAIVCLLIIWRWGTGSKVLRQSPQVSWFCLGVGLAASLPLLVSPKLRDFYLVPAIPFYALAWTSGLVKGLPELGTFWTQRLRILILIGGLAILSWGISSWGKPLRDETLLAEVHQLGQQIPAGSTVHLCKEWEWEWSLRYYLTRYYHISQDTRQLGAYPFAITDQACPPPPGPFEEEGLGLETFRLFKRR